MRRTAPRLEDEWGCPLAAPPCGPPCGPHSRVCAAPTPAHLRLLLLLQSVLLRTQLPLHRHRLAPLSHQAVAGALAWGASSMQRDAVRGGGASDR